MIYGIILAGGKGERLWPMTRENKPKYLLRFPPKADPCPSLPCRSCLSADRQAGGRRVPMAEKGESLLAQAIERIIPVTKNVIVVTTKKQRKFLYLDKRLSKFVRYIIEPQGRNTANAIRLSARALAEKDPDGIMVVLPADHIINNRDRFCDTLKAAIEFIDGHPNSLMTIGIKPTHPATGYGYIKINSKFKIQNSKCYRIEKFIEKPDIKRAQQFIRNGRYLWNSGMFIWKVNTILKAIKRHIPDNASVSIDYGVMERAKNVYVTKGDFDWCDIGSWKALEDERSNKIIGRHIGLDTKDCVVVSDEKHLIGTIGLSGMAVVHTDDATLVCPKDRAQDVRILVNELRNKRLKRYL